MLTEHRKIIFPKPELLEAIRTHDEVTDRRLVDSTVSAFSVAAEPIPCALLRVRNGSGPDVESVVLDNTFLIAAMVRYCIAKEVVVPRCARKWIEVDRQEIALVFHMDDKFAESYTFIPL